MSQSHYSLRWNNHQSHILSAFDALLQAETLVDVTLVCAETSVRAHKVVLSACSPFFQRIFSENPCKHPVIVLKDFSGWEVQAIVDFMYKGEISVIQDQLQSLIKAAESLQVRGLANQEHLEHPNCKEAVSSPTPPPIDFYRFNAPRSTPTHSPYPSPVDTHKLPHMPTLSFPCGGGGGGNDYQRPESPNPAFPRRKQARPRRRSGELCAPQDLSKHEPLEPLSSSSSLLSVAAEAENLCTKRPKTECERRSPKEERRRMLSESEKSPERTSPELDLSMHSGGGGGGSCGNLKEYHELSPHPPPNLLAPVLSLKHEMDSSHSPLPFPPMPSVSALAMTPPHSKFFGLDSPLLFPPGLDGCRNPLLELADTRSAPETPIFSKKKMGRPKGQHSAPRGGPPRSWTNAELTEALQHVWNKKMTTSQASRIFGIPYNSLLMYVRGKYGKSLKLEQLRKDCIGAPGAVDLMNIAAAAAAAGANNNNNTTTNKSSQQSGNGPAGGDNNGDISAADSDHMQQQQQPPPPHQSLFNPFAPNFYPDFGSGFPIPVSMIHLLPQSEKNHYMSSALSSMIDEDCNRNERNSVKDETPQDLAAAFLPPSAALDRRELVQQNGQD